MNGLVMSVPSREILVDETRDSETSDAFRFGHPVVRHLRPQLSLAGAVSGISDLAFPVRIGRDVFLEKTDAAKTDDLHNDLRVAAGLETVVDGV